MKRYSHISLVLVIGALIAGTVNAGPVQLLRTPDGGIQPQAVVDAQGTVYLVYFQGKPGGGDLFYTRLLPGASEFAPPLKVNSQPGSAIATGTIRGAQIALGRNGRVHVAWNGGQFATRVPVGDQLATPMLYTRLNDAGTAFEPQRDVLTRTIYLDGGGSVAADQRGNVYVVWHASRPDNRDQEAGRAVFVARSADDGKTFAPEVPVNPSRTGACGCCGLRAFADRRGDLTILFRAATGREERGMQWLQAGPGGTEFRLQPLDHWQLGICPMSSEVLTETPGGVLAAWERDEQVFWSLLNVSQFSALPPVHPPGSGKRKHPAIAQNPQGEILLAWTEDTAWEKGGSVAWQLFDKEGQPVGGLGRRDGVPVWGLVAAVAKKNGDFVVLY